MAHRPMANISLEKLSAGIADAVSELTGLPYSAEITHIDFESQLNSWMTDKTVLTVRLDTKSWPWLRESSNEANRCDTEFGRSVSGGIAPEE
jgi:hypothetical protein